MTQVDNEKRLSPRIKCKLSIDIADNSSKTIDLSEGGLSFVIDKVFETGTSLPAHIDFDFDSLDTDIELLRKEPAEDGFLYAGRYINLADSKRKKLREVLIKEQVKDILDKTDDPTLKDKVANFFLKDIKDYLDELDELKEDMSQKETYDQLLERRLISINDRIILKGNTLEKKLKEKNLIKAIKDNFRFLIGSLVYQSLIMKRAFEKPRGYPGDYKMIEDVYDNQPYSEGLGRYYDKYFLNNPYAVAVRLRKDRLREMLRIYIKENFKKPAIKILNLACGSCREVAELLKDLNYKGELTITCIDWDQEALDFSQEAIKEIPKNVKVKFLRGDLLVFIKEKKYLESIGKQDLIYSIGLIDYLPDRILKKWMQFFYQLLPQGGKFIVTHKNREKTFPPLPPNWFCDWKFVPRSKEEVIAFLNSCQLSEFSLDIDVDEFTYIFYFTLTKT